jgi:hypothetical protein
VWNRSSFSYLPEVLRHRGPAWRPPVRACIEQMPLFSPSRSRSALLRVISILLLLPRFHGGSPVDELLSTFPPPCQASSCNTNRFSALSQLFRGLGAPCPASIPACIRFIVIVTYFGSRPVHRGDPVPRPSGSGFPVPVVRQARPQYPQAGTAEARTIHAFPFPFFS